jgi:hypothetical protein
VTVFRFIPPIVCLAVLGWAASGGDGSAEVTRAKGEVDRVQRMVMAGALPRKALEEAQAGLLEAKDREIIQSTLFSKDGLQSLTEEQARLMMAAAERQVMRAQEKVAAAKKRVDEGVAPLTSLTPFLEEFDRHRITYGQAVSHARLLHELKEMIKAERELQSKLETLSNPGAARGYSNYKYDGNGAFSALHLRAIEIGFVKQFRKMLPVSAKGDTEMHRTMGYDHRGRVDVAVLPDSDEGVWLRRQLEMMRIPYIAFRTFVPGQATGAHIHIGPPSPGFRQMGTL